MSKKVILTNRENLSTNLFFDEIRKSEVISKDTENEMFIAYHTSTDVNERKKIKDQIILSNLRWCVTLSKSFICGSMEQADLRSESIEGMLNCFDQFDYTKGMKFATFASFHMRNKLNGFIYSDGKMIGDVTSNKTIDKLISKVSKELEDKLARVVSSTEIIERFNEIKPQHVAILTEDMLFERSISKFGPASLDAPFISNDGSEDGSELQTKVNFGSRYADQDIIDNEKTNAIRESLNTILTEREAEIVMMSYGLTDGFEYSPEMIASKLFLTRARIGQLLTTAIDKLKLNKKVFSTLLN